MATFADSGEVRVIQISANEMFKELSRRSSYSLRSDIFPREDFQLEKKIVYGNNLDVDVNDADVKFDHLFNLATGDYVVKVLPLKIQGEINTNYMRIVYQIVAISEENQQAIVSPKLKINPDHLARIPTSEKIKVPLLYGEFWIKVEDLSEPHRSQILSMLSN